MQILKHAFAILLATALVACGGGGGSPGTVSGSGGTSTGTSTTTTVVTTTTTVVSETVTPGLIELIASANTLPSATGTIAITVLVKSASNNGIAGQTVTFTASSGALQPGGVAITNADGVATKNLVAGASKANRTIVVSATAGSVSSSINIPVVGTALSVSGSGSLLQGVVNSSYSFRAVDSSGNPISNASLTISSALSNALSSTTVTTDGTGNASVLYGATNPGNDTLTATGLGASAQMTINVSGEDFSFLSPASGTLIPIGTSPVVTVQYRFGGIGVAGKTVTFSTTRGLVGAPTVITDSSGQATTTVSSNTSGPATVNAAIAGIAQSGLPVEFLATTPATLVLQVNPNAILPNPGGTSANSAALAATVRDPAGNPVKNVPVNFTSLSDPSGGSISPASGTTDSNGSVQARFFSGALSSPSNGVTFRAVVASSPSVSGTASLTVSGQALFITIGTGNVISNLNVSTYQKPFTVYVTDSNGAAVTNQSVVLSVYPLNYLKGVLGWTGTVYDYSGGITSCPNEDVNANGRLDAGEDTNSSGTLTPGGVVLVSPGTVVTDANGFASFDLLYGEQFAPWLRAQIKASATVAGTESSNSINFDLVGVASDFNIQANPPAGVVSPFGQAAVCSDKN